MEIQSIVILILFVYYCSAQRSIRIIYKFRLKIPSYATKTDLLSVLYRARLYQLTNNGSLSEFLCIEKKRKNKSHHETSVATRMFCCQVREFFLMKQFYFMKGQVANRPYRGIEIGGNGCGNLHKIAIYFKYNINIILHHNKITQCNVQIL